MALLNNFLNVKISYVKSTQFPGIHLLLREPESCICLIEKPVNTLNTFLEVGSRKIR